MSSDMRSVSGVQCLQIAIAVGCNAAAVSRRLYWLYG